MPTGSWDGRFDGTKLYMKRGREDDDERGGGKVYNVDSSQAGVEEDGSCLVCMLPPCNKQPTRFRTNEQFESHYYQLHCMNCSECGRLFPSENILNLHITENHDSFAQARKARGERIYGCLIESCDRFCSEEWKRRRHVIDKHGYPPNFHFGVVKFGLSKKSCNIRLGWWQTWISCRLWAEKLVGNVIHDWQFWSQLLFVWGTELIQPAIFLIFLGDNTLHSL